MSTNSSESVTARWRDGVAFEITSSAGHTVMVDEPEPLGSDTGSHPPDLLLGALSACSGIGAVSLLRKMRQPLKTLTVSGDGDRQPDWPKAYTRIRLHFEIGGDGNFDPALVEKAIRLAVKRYCAVGATIELGEGGCQIDYDYVIATQGAH